MGKNCWEYKKCNREPNGSDSIKLGVCPASTDTMLNGANNGKNAGRACWVIAGTFCGGIVQGTFANKISNCNKCDFFKTVKFEEDKDFENVRTIMTRKTYRL